MKMGVVGGGVVGLCLCYELISRGVRVTLFEKEEATGLGVSSVALGGITPFSDDFIAERLGNSAETVLTLFRNLVAELGVENDVLSYHDTGVMYVAFDDKELSRLCGPFSDLFPSTLTPKVLSAIDIQKLERSVSCEAVGGLLVDCEPSIDPAKLMGVLLGKLMDSPLFAIKCGVFVERVEDSGTVFFQSDGRSKQETFDFVTVCTGVGNNVLGSNPSLRMVGIKGQAISCKPLDERPHELKHHIYAHIHQHEEFEVSAYIVPRGPSELIVGVTYEEQYLQSLPDIKGLSAIFKGVTMLLPSAKDWQITSLRSGIRPVSVDRGPLVGFRGVGSNVLMSIGHYGLGVTLAPYSAKIISNLIGIEEIKPVGSDEFSPSRLPQ